LFILLIRKAAGNVTIILKKETPELLPGFPYLVATLYSQTGIITNGMTKVSNLFGTAYMPIQPEQNPK